MSIKTAGKPKKCPHCGEWLVTPEQAKQQRIKGRKFILIWTTVFMAVIFGAIFISSIYNDIEHEKYISQFEQLALGRMVDIDYWSDGAYEVYFSNLYVDGVPQDIKRHVFSFKDSITALPMIDQCCIFWGHGHEVHYIEYV